MAQLTVTPAYGRDYKSAKEAKADWDANKDFVNETVFGEYAGSGVINKEQVKAGASVTIRFARKAKLTQFYV